MKLSRIKQIIREEIQKEAIDDQQLDQLLSLNRKTRRNQDLKKQKDAVLQQIMNDMSAYQKLVFDEEMAQGKTAEEAGRIAAEEIRNLLSK